MRITYDPEAEAIYIYVKRGKRVPKTEELEDGIFLDKNEKGEILGIEILWVPDLKVEIEK